MVPLALLTLVVGAAAAWGIGSGTASGTAPTTFGHAAAGELTSAVSSTSDASSAALTLSAISVADGTTTTLATGSGSFDLSKGVGQATVTAPVLASVPGVGTDDSVGVIVDGGTLYLNIPALSALAGGKDWFSTAIPATAMAGGAIGSLSATALGDPTKLLALLTEFGGTVAKLGTPNVDGVATTEFETALDVSQIDSEARETAQASHHQASSSKSSRGASRSSGGVLKMLGLSTVPVKVWVGSDGLVRQVQLTLDLAHLNLADPTSLLHGLTGGSSTSSITAPSAGSGSVVTVTLGFSSFGVPVSATAPPASQVADLQRTLLSLKGVLSSIASPVLSRFRAQAG